MTERIKLTKEDILIDEAGVVPNGLQVKIYIDHQTGFEKAKKLKQQLLDDQETAKKSSIYKDFYDKWHLTLQENKQLKDSNEQLESELLRVIDEDGRKKQKLEHITKLLQGKDLSNPNDDYHVHAEVRNILGDSTS